MKLATFKIKARGQQTIGIFDGEKNLDVVARTSALIFMIKRYKFPGAGSKISAGRAA